MLAWRDNRLSANGDTQARRVVFAPGLVDHVALAYDGLNRLKSVSGAVSETFALDQASNIDSRTGPTQDYSYDQANRLTSDGAQTFSWSSADRLAQRGSDVFGYDALDRLTSSTVAGTARIYAYNGDGLLKSRTQGAATQFLWDPSSSPSWLLKQGGDHIVYGLGPLYVVKADATTLTFARDGSKNVRAEVSSTGAVTAAFRYRAYGQLAQSTTNGPTYLGLASQLLDPSGLYYMRARWYEPTTGRFITHDPIQGDAGTPTSLNSYGYAASNPLMNSDPTGLCSDPNAGSSGTRYCVAAYIPSSVACGLGCYRGDNRGPDAHGGTSRVEFGIDESGEIVNAHSDFSVREDYSERARANPVCLGGGGTYYCVASNPMETNFPLLGYFVPPIEFTVSFDGNGVNVRGRAFPSYEVWRYNPDGTADNLFGYNGYANPFGPFGLFFTIDAPNLVE